MRRLHHAASRDLGLKVPSGVRLRAWVLWLIAAFFVAIGLGFLIGGSGHEHLILAGALWLAAIFLVARTLAPNGER